MDNHDIWMDKSTRSVLADVFDETRRRMQYGHIGTHIYMIQFASILILPSEPSVRE